MPEVTYKVTDVELVGDVSVKRDESTTRFVSHFKTDEEIFGVLGINETIPTDELPDYVEAAITTVLNFTKSLAEVQAKLKAREDIGLKKAKEVVALIE